MTITMYPTEIQAIDENKELVFTVETFDSHCAVIKLHSACHSEASWVETSEAIRQALVKLELET